MPAVPPWFPDARSGRSDGARSYAPRAGNGGCRLRLLAAAKLQRRWGSGSGVMFRGRAAPARTVPGSLGGPAAPYSSPSSPVRWPSLADGRRRVKDRDAAGSALSLSEGLALQGPERSGDREARRVPPSTVIAAKAAIQERGSSLYCVPARQSVGWIAMKIGRFRQPIVSLRQRRGGDAADTLVRLSGAGSRFRGLL